MILVKVASPVTSFDLGQFLQATNYDTQQVTNQQVKVLCYPSGNAIQITLPPTDFTTGQNEFPTGNLQVLVGDASGSAGTHNITIAAGIGNVSEAQEHINAAVSVTIAANKGSYAFEILTTGAWVGTPNG